MYPRLTYTDEVAALEYLTRVFQFTERREARMGGGHEDEGMLAWLEFGDGVVMIGRATAAARDAHHLYSPGAVGRATVTINGEGVGVETMQGKVAIVTGASAGIVRAASLPLAREGANVVLADLDVERGEKTATEAATSGAETLFVRTDVSDATSVAYLVRATV